MAKTKQKKEEIVKNLVEKLKKVKSVVFANFDKLSVKELEELRNKCEEQNIDLEVTKKTLLKNAIKKAELKEVDVKSFERGVSTVFGYEDEVLPAKIIADFAKDHESLKMYGGLIENEYVDEAYLLQLAKLPSKQELYAKVVGSLKSPIAGFVFALKGNLSNLVYTLQAIKESKE
ncbi:50S ribosomal protein L10 [Patescibacteria group bacterium]|nr:50S ribosomal protein L10 [Patescibacteria group bacterium]